ncbi:MAG: hypothetical protein ABI433_21070, partial [Burkholderiaceae bacterium]
MKVSAGLFSLAARVDLHIRRKNARQFENHRALQGRNSSGAGALRSRAELEDRHERSELDG